MNEMTRENARKLKILNCPIDELINILLKFQQIGESVVVEWKDHKLYSCDITMDGAYQELFGMTKAECDKKEKEWIERGKEFIYPEKMEYWKRVVTANFNEGKIIDNALALMEKVESGASIEEIKSLYVEQNQPNDSILAADRLLLGFAKKGPEFYESMVGHEMSKEDKAYIEYYKRQNAEIEKTHSHLKATAVKVDISVEKDDYTGDNYWSDLEGVVKKLEEYRDRGESVVIQIAGNRLYSCDVTMNNAYRAIYGNTKEEMDKAWEEIKTKEEEKAKIPEWVERGKEFIYPELMEDWEDLVTANFGKGKIIDNALALMEKLESGASIEEVKALYAEQNQPNDSYLTADSLLLQFSKKGPEFYESMIGNETSEKDKKRIEYYKRKNAELAELHKADSTKEVSAERLAEEKEIVDLSLEKEQLESEVGDIEKQLDELRLKEAELKKSLEEKQYKLNGLEEK